MTKDYIADKATLDNVNNIVSAFNNRWPDARAGKVDNIQAVLNTPNGDTLAAWLQSIANSAASAYNKANDANNNAANAANLASQANNNAWNAYQEAVNAKNAAGGSAVKSVQRGIITIPNETSDAAATISYVNVNKAIVVYGGSVEGRNYMSSGVPGVWDVKLVLESATSVRATRGSNSYKDPGTPSVPYQVIEFY